MTTQDSIQQLKTHVSQQILGQENLVERLLIALLADGHLLVEGAPGLAKTTAIKALAEGIDCDFHRVQFTPDLLPADLIGTEIYRPQDGSFQFQQGPLFHNMVLADEINRAPAKVQSALLEAMAERQVTVGRTTYPLAPLFLVMATQNPIEQEGTYPLPEAQLDRFLLYVRINAPDAATEKRILQLTREQARSASSPTESVVAEKISQQALFDARQEAAGIHMAEALDDYLVQLIMASRNPGQWGEELARWISFGASPRATIALDRCARARAWLAGRDFVTPEDIQDIAPDVLRHRLILSFEAEADGVTGDQVIQQILERIPVP